MIQPFQKKLIRSTSRRWSFEAIDVGKCHMSIQGSEFHYSDPKANVAATEYTHMEVAVFDHKDRWAMPDGYEHWFEDPGGGTSVGSHIPVEVIQQMIDAIEDSGLPDPTGIGPGAAKARGLADSEEGWADARGA